MSKALNEKVAIVTGGAAGIGKAAVELFAAEGARVVIADLQQERGEALAAQLGDRALFRTTDVSKADQVESLVDFAVESFGGLDVMYNNAGVTGHEGTSVFFNNDFSNFDKVMAVDLLGPMLGSKYAALAMAEHGGGSIINTASTAGTYAGYGLPEYRAAKAGVISLTRSLAIELGEHGIRVNCISPGPIKTEIVGLGAAGMPEGAMEKILESSMDLMTEAQVLDRVGLPDDIAQAALFLASDRSAQITGLDLIVDGGMTLGDKVNRQAKMEAAIGQIMGQFQEAQ